MSVDAFSEQWLAHPLNDPPRWPYEKVVGTVGITLYRRAPYQVQLWICPPHTVIGDHSHPDIDGWAVLVAGEIRFTLAGRMTVARDHKIVRWNGRKTFAIRTGHGQVHGVLVGQAGGSFLSITERLDGGEPVSVHRNWSGPPLDADHEMELA